MSVGGSSYQYLEFELLIFGIRVIKIISNRQYLATRISKINPKHGENAWWKHCENARWSSCTVSPSPHSFVLVLVDRGAARSSLHSRRVPRTAASAASRLL